MKSGISGAASALVAILIVINCAIFFATPYAGDDLVYDSCFSGPFAIFDNWASFPHWVAIHWLSTNGRFFNLLLPPILALNKVLLSILCACMVGLMYLATLKACGRAGNNTLLSILLVAALAFGLPWWDSMTIIACQVNYVWASAFLMIAYRLVASDNNSSGTKTFLAAIICFAAGASHEAGSLPLCAGLLFYLIVNRIKPGGSRRILLLALAAGTVFVAFCPGILLRAATDTKPDDSIVLLTLKNAPAVLAMLLVFCLMALNSSGRRRLKELLHQPESALAVAAVTSTVVSVMSGIVGRSGWFAEIYAITVLFSLLSAYNPQGKAASTAAVLLAALVIAQSSLVAVWQVKLNHENAEFERQYIESPDGLVFMDRTCDTVIPAATLGRFRAVPDGDDHYLLLCLRKYYKPDGPYPVILPPQARLLQPEQSGFQRFDSGDYITAQLPENATRLNCVQDLFVFSDKGTDWVAQPFEKCGRHYYFCSRRIHDAGDRD